MYTVISAFVHFPKIWILGLEPVTIAVPFPSIVTFGSPACPIQKELLKGSFWFFPSVLEIPLSQFAYHLCPKLLVG
jgi:hypothetical protein